MIPILEAGPAETLRGGKYVCISCSHNNEERRSATKSLRAANDL